MSRKLKFETCEARLVLTTTIYLDFGLDLDSQEISTTVEEFKNFLDTDGTVQPAEAHTGTNLMQPQITGQYPQAAIAGGNELRFKSLGFDFNGGGFNEQDLIDMSGRVVDIMNDALLPFDVNVVVVNESVIGHTRYS